MARALTEDDFKVLEAVHEHGFAWSFMELVKKGVMNDSKLLRRTLDTLQDEGWLTNGPATWEKGQSVKTWMTTVDGELALGSRGVLKVPVQEPNKSDYKQGNQDPLEYPVELDEIKIMPVEADETPDLLKMFDDSVAVIRTAIEASMAKPVVDFDVDKAAVVLNKYAQVARAAENDADAEALTEIRGFLVQLEG